ncbi:MAG: metallophosphoesterase [Bacteroidota bacterium]
MAGRVMVMGDIHGNLRAFDQCMERCRFDNDQDVLIQLGDVSDRLPDTALVVERLLNLNNLVAIRGNHDEWVRSWFETNTPDPSWLVNGGQPTLDSYRRYEGNMDMHKSFFSDQKNYHIDVKGRIFVHGGFTHPKGPAYDLIVSQCLWDRSLWKEALMGKDLNKRPAILSGFREIYIGHTPTLNWFQEQPMNAFNVWNLDTGAGHPSGRLSIIDIETKEYWQSDPTNILYDLGS